MSDTNFTESSDLLLASEVDWCKTKLGINNQIAFGLMLAHFKIFVKFPSIDDKPLPMHLLTQTVEMLGFELLSSFSFDWSSRTAKRYRNEIREYLGFREVTENDAHVFITYLIEDILPKHPSHCTLSKQVKKYFQEQKIEIFKSKKLKRYIASAKHQFEQLFFQSIFDHLSRDERNYINQVLTEDKADKSNNIISLVDLKKDMPGARLKNINSAIKKIQQCNKIAVPDELFKSVDRKLLLKYYDRIMALSPSNISEFSIKTKYATMAIFCYIRSQLMLDSLADAFIKLIHRMRTNAESHVDGTILKEVKRVNGKFDILEKLAVTTAHNPKAIIEDTVYPEVSKETLLELIEDLSQRGKWYQKQVQNKIHSNYAHGSRNTLLPILEVFRLKEDHIIYKPILEAIAFIQQHWEGSDTEYYSKAPPIDNIIPKAWESMVFDEVDGKVKVNKYNYEIAVLEQVKSFIGFKAIWIESTYRYRDPNEDIPQDFEKNKEYYYNLLNLPSEAKAFTKKSKQSLKHNLKTLNVSILDNSLVRIKESSTNRNITITPSPAQDEPTNIVKLQKEITQKWSTINLIDILKESDLLINFTEQMETIAKNSNIPEDELRKRLLLCLYGIGSNTGLKRISIANRVVSYSDLRYAKKRFINKTNVRNAIRLVVNKVLEVRDPEIWGEATTTVACDSTQVIAWDQNLLNEFHHRYKEKGVILYWHVDKKALCVYSQLKDCSSSEVGSMIKGVLDHDTKMNMNRVFVDTHGQSVIGFAISYLLDFDLLPRLKAINKQKVCGVTSNDKEKYDNIAPIIKGTINWKLIEKNYDDVVKHMAALKLVIVEPSILIKRLSHNNYNHPVYKALLEIGKANKSIFLCKYLTSEPLRVEINEGLNVVERLNNVMDFIFYGKLGEMKTNNTNDQELSLLCLHLLQACMVYINTLIIQEVLSAPHWKNKLTPEDYRALTPLLSAHINPYGLFPVDFNHRIAMINTHNDEASNEQNQSHTRMRKSETALQTA